MDEHIWSDDYLTDSDTLNVHVVETTDAMTGKTIFIAMSDDSSQIIGKGETCDDAVVDLETKMFEVDEFDDSPWEIKLAS